MLQYAFVILHILIYYACMSYAADPGSVTIGGNGNKSVTQPDERCNVLKKQVYMEKTKCFEDLLSGKSKNESNCTDVSSMKKYFEAEFNKTALCYEPAVRKIINSSLHMRLDFLENVLQNVTNVKKFFDNGGLQCIKATKGPINKECISNEKGIDQTKLANSFLRQRILFIDKPTCSRGEKILNCIKKTVNKTCTNPNTSIEFIISIYKPLQGNCYAMTKITDPKPPPKKSNVTGIIIGCLVALIVVLLLTLFFIRNRKRSDSQNRQSQSYNVSFQQNNADSSRTKGNV